MAQHKSLTKATLTVFTQQATNTHTHNIKWHWIWGVVKHILLLKLTTLIWETDSITHTYRMQNAPITKRKKERALDGFPFTPTNTVHLYGVLSFLSLPLSLSWTGTRLAVLIENRF